MIIAIPEDMRDGEYRVVETPSGMREYVPRARAGHVVVVVIDPGRSFGALWPTSHSDPAFLGDQVIHFRVANMPSVVPRAVTQESGTGTSGRSRAGTGRRRRHRSSLPSRSRGDIRSCGLVGSESDQWQATCLITAE